MALLKGGKGNKDTTVSYFSRSELLVVNYGRILVTPSRISSHSNIRKQNTYSIVNEYRSGVLPKGKRPPEVSTASSIKRSPLQAPSAPSTRADEPRCGSASQAAAAAVAAPGQ